MSLEWREYTQRMQRRVRRVTRLYLWAIWGRSMMDRLTIYNELELVRERSCLLVALWTNLTKHVILNWEVLVCGDDCWLDDGGTRCTPSTTCIIIRIGGKHTDPILCWTHILAHLQKKRRMFTLYKCGLFSICRVCVKGKKDPVLGEATVPDNVY